MIVKAYKEIEKKLECKTYDSIDENTEFEKDSWLIVKEASASDLELLSKKTGILLEFLMSSLDEEESAHIDREDDCSLIVLDTPLEDPETGEINTMPFIIAYNSDYYVTIADKNDKLIDIVFQKVKNIEPHKKVRLTLNIFYQLSREFITFLHKIDNHTKDVEQRIHSSMKNKEIFELMDINKTFVYFSTALNADKVVLNKLIKTPAYKRYEDDLDLMEDAQVEIDQAIEMCTIYRDILAGMMDAFASIISNNLNIVMKTLTIITIVISIPTLVASLFGMNFDDLPLQTTHFGFWIIFILSIVLSIICAIVLTLITRNNSRKK